MAIEVGTNSYITANELTQYALDRGITITGDIEVLLIKSMDYLETRNYKGYKTVDTQLLQFPRVIDGYDSLTVPAQIKNAQMVASILIGQGKDLQPTLERATKREKVDVIEVEYMDNNPQSAQFTALNDILRPFLLGSANSKKIVRC